MGSARQTVERIQLGLALLRFRERAGSSQQEAADVMGRTAARLSQVENGRGSLGQTELLKLLDFYEVTDTERDAVLHLAKVSRRRQSTRSTSDYVPNGFWRHSDLQSAASRIDWFECGIVPGVVQSEDYARAIISAGDGLYWESSRQVVDERVEFRIDLQRRLLDAVPRKSVDVVFTEDALRKVVGSTATMRGQILHLLQLMEREDGPNIRVVLDTAVDNPALGGGFMVLHFPGESSPIAYASTLYGTGSYFDRPEDTSKLLALFGRVEQLALSCDSTRGLLVEILGEM